MKAHVSWPVLSVTTSGVLCNLFVVLALGFAAAQAQATQANAQSVPSKPEYKYGCTPQNKHLKRSDFSVQGEYGVLVIAPDQNFYSVEAYNASKTSALLIKEGRPYGAKYNYLDYDCMVSVEVSKLTYISRVKAVTAKGEVALGQTVVLNNRSKGEMMGVARDGRLALKVFEADRPFKAPYEKHNPTLVSESEILRVFNHHNMYFSCEKSYMFGRVVDVSDTKIFYGTDTDKLMKKCKASGLTNCQAGVYSKYSSKVDLGYYALCVRMMPRGRAGECNPVVTDDSKSSPGVLGWKFDSKKMDKSDPHFCLKLSVCNDSSNLPAEISVYDELERITNCSGNN